MKIVIHPTVPDHASDLDSGHPLLFEMLRSFTSLAVTLNLSHSVTHLKSTRQTVRRHIAQLEEMKGGPLFEVRDRQYVLTDLGQTVLPDATELLARAKGWATGDAKKINGLQYLKRVEPDGRFFYQQQQPIGRAFSAHGTILQDVLKAWTEAGGDLEHQALRDIRRFTNVFRRADSEWLFTEVGEQSSYVSWYGLNAARSTIGRSLMKLPAGDLFGSLVNEAYASVEASQSARLDHIFTLLPTADNAEVLPACYERLLIGTHFADKSFAMLSMVRRTYHVDIEGVTDEMLKQMPEKFLMD